jgi:hypothetical protein
MVKSANGKTTIGRVKSNRVSIVRDAEGYDTLVVACSPDEPVFAGWAYNDYIDKRLVIERGGLNVPTMRTEGVFMIRYPEPGRNMMHLTAFSGEVFLDRRIVAYYAGTAYTNKTADADDMMKAVVRENLGATATVTTRALSDLTVDADAGLGPSLTRAFCRQNVLSVIQGIQENSRAAGSEVFWRMYPNGDGWRFATMLGQLGTDRRELGMHLSEANENIIITSAGFDASEEVNSMYAGGQGRNELRLIGTASDTSRIALSPYNLREAFYSAAMETTQAGVDDAAEQELSKRRAKRVLAGTITERMNFRYGIEWDFGDKMRVEHGGQTYDVIVRKVKIDITDRGENITAFVEVEE